MLASTIENFCHEVVDAYPALPKKKFTFATDKDYASRPSKAPTESPT